MFDVFRSFRELLAGFFRWWFSELCGLVPSRLRTVFRPSRRTLRVRISGNEMTISTERARGEEESVTIDLASHDPESVRAEVGAILKRYASRNTDVVLCVSSEQALLRTLDLPDAAEPELHQALELQIDRLTPLSRQDACFDHRIVARRPETRRLSVQLVVVPRAFVEESVREAEHWGVRPDIVDIRHEEAADTPTFNLLDEIRGARPPRSYRRLNFALSVLAIILGIGLVQSSLDKRAAALNKLESSVAAARKEAAAIAAPRNEIEQLIADQRFLAERKDTSPSALRSLDELTRVLPDHTWLLTFKMDGDKIEISGLSESPSSLIGLIDKSPLFREPAFQSSVSRDRQSGFDRFSLSFRISRVEEK